MVFAENLNLDFLSLGYREGLSVTFSFTNNFNCDVFNVIWKESF